VNKPGSFCLTVNRLFFSQFILFMLYTCTKLINNIIVIRDGRFQKDPNVFC
jgi:hypothetical protein